MSYQVLARKWRPRIFREMVGQEHVLKAIINALDRGQLHHAYLFTGTRGVGKTTIARIFAKCLNCEQGVSSEPCGQCSACQEIAEGRFVDLIEVDAASRTKVEDTRELLENVQYSPTRGRYKVYLIDEVHMLSSHSFNALLKTLEEPPPHVKFLLATTDPQKLPATILSRCLQFHLKNMTPERIVAHLRHVLDQELVPFEEGALWQLARSADGSMRDALSLTDQAIAFGSGRVSDHDVAAMLGTLDRGLVLQLLASVVSGEGAQVLQAVGRLSEQSPDYEGALGDLQRLLHRIALAQAVPASLDGSNGDEEALRALAVQLAAEDIQLYYQIALQARRDFPYAPDARSALEMALLRMLAFRPEGVAEPPAIALGGGSSGRAPVTAIAGAQPQAAEAVVAQAAPIQAPVPPSRAQLEPAPPRSEAGLQQSEPATPVPAAVIAMASADPEPEPAPPLEPARDDALQALDNSDWLAIFPRLDVAGLARSVASHCVLASVGDGSLRFVLDERHSALFNASQADILSDSLGRLLGRSLAVNIAPGAIGEVETPAAQAARIAAERQAGALELMRSDPNVRWLTEHFGASLIEASVKPGI